MESKASELSGLAKAILANLNPSAQLSVLDTAATLYKNVFLVRSNPQLNRSALSCCMAATLHAQYRRTNHRADLDGTISSLHEASHLNLFPDLPAGLATRFDKTGELSDLLGSMIWHRDFLPTPAIPRKPVNYLAPPTINQSNQAGQIIDIGRAIQSDQVTDLSTAISFFYDGLAQPPSQSVGCTHSLCSIPVDLALNSLAVVPKTQFKQLGRSNSVASRSVPITALTLFRFP